MEHNFDGRLPEGGRGDYPPQAGSVPHNHKPPSTSELISGAKYLAQAAQHALHHDTGKIDKAKAADAAGDLLEAASHYGKLNQKGYGKYVQKAESYLHKYGDNSHHSKPHSSAPPSGHNPMPTANPGRRHDDAGGIGGGMGDYMKLAQQFMKK